MKPIHLFSIFSLLASGSSLLFGQSTPPAVSPPLPIPVVLAPWEKTVTLPAEAAPYYRVTLGTPVTGWVDSIKADIGSILKKGDLLAEIRAPELVAARDARVEEARAAEQGVTGAAAMLESAKAEARAVESEYNRLRQLSTTGTVTTKPVSRQPKRESPRPKRESPPPKPPPSPLPPEPPRPASSWNTPVLSRLTTVSSSRGRRTSATF
jgi:multidrug efflux pump subunit AcrA (membrane-fusion protein)